MQNKPNLMDVKMNENLFATKVYENETDFRLRENKPNQTQFFTPLFRVLYTLRGPVPLVRVLYTLRGPSPRFYPQNLNVFAIKSLPEIAENNNEEYAQKSRKSNKNRNKTQFIKEFGNVLELI